MEQRRLGRTDVHVSALCLGTMTFGEQNSEAEGHAQMDYALDKGINFFDAAELYPIPPKKETQGRTERIIGAWFKKTGNRDKVVMATKVVGRTVMDWFRENGKTGELSRDQIEFAVDRSLKNLETDYIDLYQIHWPDRAVSGFGSNPTRWSDVDPVAGENSIESTLEILADLVKAGKIRHIGISNESAWGTMRFVAASERLNLPRIVSIQNAYSLVNRTFETGLAEVARREDVGLLAYSVLAQGYLTGKYRDGALPAGSRKTLFDRLQRYEHPRTLQAVNAYVDLAKEAGLDPSQMAIAHAMSRSFMTSVILGATRMEQLETDIGAADITLSPDLLDKIDALHQEFGNPAP
ncbi:NADP(H)-dependent aldo-keto reductase [Roseibium denhamense]|uniref:Predicted oxidoreductase n=1 Tax=Roseibium denhamense TaxID=76305 RepID=A0ABY1P998_9HYPH|nr:NADP(H)-dependent aldo-keto reductase [Roseibium denhamense]MTI07400.1 NADP(H)-dependent aldo-keto reductase [Roseibium denhamense]SMP29374.1 Predicted oxidoreductase [Roseibium denhamense]